MSLPSFPLSDTTPTREQVVNQIISSIAMEELGLSHIINAEGEKLQYALGTIPGMTGPEQPLTMQEILDLNASIHKTLESTMMNQFLLKEKLVGALSASVMQGPTGPTGPQGPATIDVDTDVDELDPGVAPTVENTGTLEDAVFKFGIPRGATGPTGAVEVSGMQVVLENAGGETEIAQNGVIPFNQVQTTLGTDITYNAATGVFTIDATGANNLYQINWWLFIEGAATADPVTLSLNVGGTQYQISAPWTERQLFGSTLAVVGEAPIQISLTNTTASAVTLSDVSVQAQISIIGLGSPS